MVDVSRACVGRQRTWVLLPLLPRPCSVMCKMSVLVPPCQFQVSVTEPVLLPMIQEIQVCQCSWKSQLQSCEEWAVGPVYPLSAYTGILSRREGKGSECPFFLIEI